MSLWNSHVFSLLSLKTNKRNHLLNLHFLREDVTHQNCVIFDNLKTTLISLWCTSWNTSSGLFNNKRDSGRKDTLNLNQRCLRWSYFPLTYNIGGGRGHGQAHATNTTTVHDPSQNAKYQILVNMFWKWKAPQNNSWKKQVKTAIQVLKRQETVNISRAILHESF